MSNYKEREEVMTRDFIERERQLGIQGTDGHGGHLGGPDDDHYAALPIQPIQLTEQMSEHWPRAVIYHLGEALAAVMRVGSKGQDVRDLRKASWLLERAADKLEGR